MNKNSGAMLFVGIALILTLVLIIRVMYHVELSNVNDNKEEIKEVEVNREYIDIKSLSKKVLEKVIIVNNVVFEKITNKDKGIKESLVKVIDGNVDKILKPLSNKIHDYDNDEVSEKDTIISSKIKVKVK